LNPDTIEVSSINNEVYDRLRQQIILGSIAPGQKISIRSAAEAFGVSTMPVREALRKLQAEGLITFERRSVTVNQLSLEEVKQIFQIRGRLEMLAAEWAIEKVTDKDIEELRCILQKMDQENITMKEWRKLNRTFHIRFYECAGSSLIIEAIENVWDKVEPYMAIYTSCVADFAEGHKQHIEMLSAIEKHDLALLVEEISEHMKHTSHVVSETILRARKSIR
jgi:DNA-binding GntR family transcriptional regulator